jgi:hypothetical protein
VAGLPHGRRAASRRQLGPAHSIACHASHRRSLMIGHLRRDRRPLADIVMGGLIRVRTRGQSAPTVRALRRPTGHHAIDALGALDRRVPLRLRPPGGPLPGRRDPLAPGKSDDGGREAFWELRPTKGTQSCDLGSRRSRLRANPAQLRAQRDQLLVDRWGVDGAIKSARPFVSSRARERLPNLIVSLMESDRKCHGKCGSLHSKHKALARREHDWALSRCRSLSCAARIPVASGHQGNPSLPRALTEAKPMDIDQAAS